MGITQEEIILFLIYITEAVKYWIGLRGIWSINANYIKALLIGGVVYGVLILKGIIDYATPLVWVAGVVIIMLTTMPKKSKRNKMTLFKAILVITCIGEIIGLIILIGRESMTYATSINYYFINNVICIGLLTLLTMIKQNKFIFSKKELHNIFQKSIHIVISIIAIVLLLTISSVQFAVRYVDNISIKLLFLGISIFSFMGVGLLGIIFSYIDNENKTIKKHFEAEQILLKTQEKYYDAMLEKEEDTRKFRHDIKNHMICLNELADNENAEQVKKYILDLSQTLHTIESRYCSIGNPIIDAITNYYVRKASTDINIEILGMCNCEFAVSEVDLCTIFSNLVQNAFEELNRRGSKGYIKIVFNKGESYIKIEIINSLQEEWKEKNKFVSLKNDKKNHGIGLNNVQDTVEKIGGKFEILIKDLEFRASVILPIKNDNR